MKDIMIMPVSIKDITTANDDNYVIDLLAAVYNNIDLGRDKCLPGCFTKTLRDKGNTRPVLWQHQMSQPLGKGFHSDSTRGLNCKAILPKSDDFVKNRVMPQVNIGSINGASFGYDTIDADYDQVNKCRNLKEVDLFETSLVTIPMNPQAAILSVTKAANNMGVCEFKGMDKNLKSYIYELYESIGESKGVTPYHDYPFADDTIKWDADAAIKNIKKFTGSEDKPSAKYKDCFLWYDSSAADNFTSYKLPYVNVIDGKLKIVPKAIYAIAGALSGSRGGIDIPAADKAKLKSRLNKFYGKMGKDSPFKDNGKSFIIADTLKYMTRKQITGILDGDDDIEMSKGAKEYILDGFRGEEIHLGSNQGTVKSAALVDLLETIKQFNAKI